jgi:hypothetical protein
MKRVHLAVWFLAILLGSAASASERQLENAALLHTGVSGTAADELVEIRWRRTSFTKYGPEVAILLENKSKEPLQVRISFAPAICGERAYGLTKDAADWFLDYYGQDIRIEIQPGGWNALSLPAGLALKETPPSGERCVVSISIKAFTSTAVRRHAIAVPRSGE